MNEHKRPEQVADEQIEVNADSILAGDEAWFRAQLIAAINADRAQRSEPTDAQVLAALNAFAPWSTEYHLSDWAEGNVIPMRAALRAANNVQEES